MAATRIAPPLDDIVAAYNRCGSVHGAGKELGVSHSTVHYWLGKAGLMHPRNDYSEAEREAIVAYYKNTPDHIFNLDVLACELGRPKTNISRFARQHGLTIPTRASRTDVIEQQSARMKQWMADNEHPRGFLGGTHSPEARAAISDGNRLSWITAKTFGIGVYSDEQRQARSDRMSLLQSSNPPSNPYSRCKSGVRADLNLFVRSGWEANYARYLNWLKERGDITSWRYEPKTFWFDAIKRGVRSYKPDFSVVENGKEYFVEVKGWMDDKSKTKLKRMRKYHPDVDIRLVGQKQYKEIADKLGRVIPHWE